jgi:hypothetical protein
MSGVGSDAETGLLAIGDDRREHRPVSHAHRHQAMLAAYGFGLFAPPPLREARVGSWRLVRHLPSLAEGYGSGAVVEPSRYVLYRGRTAWMSSGLMELESHAWHVHQAHGLVVAAGLGLGLYAYACCARSEVDRVVILEREPEVVELFSRSTRIAEWPGGAKLTVIVADALSPRVAETIASAVGSRHPEYFYADIWSACAAPDAPAETATMVAALRPRAAGWWGQELSFGLWCGERGYEADAAALQEYGSQVGVPIPVIDGYVRFCRDIIASRLPSRLATWRPAAVQHSLWRRLLAGATRRLFP